MTIVTSCIQGRGRSVNFSNVDGDHTHFGTNHNMFSYFYSRVYYHRSAYPFGVLIAIAFAMLFYCHSCDYFYNRKSVRKLQKKQFRDVAASAFVGYTASFSVVIALNKVFFGECGGWLDEWLGHVSLHCR